MSAKTIKCQNCGSVFWNVDEVQLHADQTGHNKFEESDEIPTIFRCNECNKPCRSVEEKEIHSKRTNHSSFTQEDLHSKNTVNVREEFNAIQQRERENLRAEMAEISGAKEGSVSTSSSTTAKTATTTAKTVKNDLPQEPVEKELLAPEVNQSMVEELCGMGFPRNRAIRAVYFSSQTSLENAIEWLTSHEDDMDIDDELLVDKPNVRYHNLTPDEKAAVIEELRIKNKAKRERDEKNDFIMREKERIRDGKKMAELRQVVDDQQLQRDIEARKREKREDELARARMKEILRQEKEARMLAAGYTPDQIKAALQPAETPKPTASGSKTTTTTTPTHHVDKSETARLHEALVHLKNSNSEEVRKVAFTTIQAYVTNIATNPNEEKFRKIKLTNKAFQSRVAAAQGGPHILELVGFEKQTDATDGSEAFVMSRDRVNVELLTTAAKFCYDALTNPFFGAF